MDITSLPNDIWILIIHKMFVGEQPHIDGGDVDTRSYFFENPSNEYQQGMYFAYYYGLLMQVSKTMNLGFKHNDFWKHVLKVDDIEPKGNNLMKRYIGVKVVPYYKKISLYYNGKYKDEKLTMECCIRNYNKLFSSKMTENIKEPLNPLILIDGYWNIEVKDRIQDNGNGYAKMYYQKYRRPVKKVYKWELHVSGNHEKIIQENVQYYMEQLVYYEDLYNSSINV